MTTDTSAMGTPMSSTALERVTLLADNPFLTTSDADFIVTLCDGEENDPDVIALAGRLDWSPKKNWVENAGGLPKYIEDIALALIRGGMERARAIATAVSRVKKWAVTGKADTKAKAVAAVAAWNALKAKNKAKGAAK